MVFDPNQLLPVFSNTVFRHLLRIVKGIMLLSTSNNQRDYAEH